MKHIIKLVLALSILALYSCVNKYEKAVEKYDNQKYYDAYFILEEVDSNSEQFTQARALMMDIDHILDSIKYVEHLEESLRVAKYEIERFKKDRNDDNTKGEIVFEQFKSLYKELLEIKDKSDFKIYGFGVGGPYNKWLISVQALKDNPDSKLLLNKGVLIGELEQLGLEYASSKGQETEVTKFFNKIFSEAISSNPVETSEE